MASFSTIIYEKSGGVAQLSLNRPRQLNAYSIAMRDDFAETLAAAAEDSEIKSILITGQGRAFCAGADLSEFGSAPSQVIARSVRWQRNVWGQMIDMPKPTVVAAHGYCIGSGLEIALLTDIRIAAEDTIFAMPEAHLGMIPAAGGSQTLPRYAGPSRALDLLLTGRRLDAFEAQEMGLVNRTVPARDLLDCAWDVAARLAEMPTALTGGVRRALREGEDLPLEAALKLERRLAATTMGIDRQPETG